jgi:hypothetical protein
MSFATTKGFPDPKAAATMSGRLNIGKQITDKDIQERKGYVYGKEFFIAPKTFDHIFNFHLIVDADKIGAGSDTGAYPKANDGKNISSISKH